MKAIITSKLNSGLGDMYSNVYRIYDVQEQLKKIGYELKVILEFGTNPYKCDGNDREVFKKIFKLEKLDNVEILSDGLDLINFNLSNSHIKIYNYEHIYAIFVDEKIDDFDNVHHMKHSWYYRDDLPKINFLSDEVTIHAENKLKEMGDCLVGIHFRPGDHILSEQDLIPHISTINGILNENSDRNVYISTSKELLKTYLLKSSYTNVRINKFNFPEVHDSIRSLELDNDQLFELLKEILCDMYILSKCEKIYRIANWFSGFLFFSCTFNQTNISNRDRFIPECPIIEL